MEETKKIGYRITIDLRNKDKPTVAVFPAKDAATKDCNVRYDELIAAGCVGSEAADIGAMKATVSAVTKDYKSFRVLAWSRPRFKAIDFNEATDEALTDLFSAAPQLENRDEDPRIGILRKHLSETALRGWIVGMGVLCALSGDNARAAYYLKALAAEEK